MTEPLHVVGLLSSMVPYHHARWQAFAQAAEGDMDCLLLELTDRDEFSVLEYAGQEAAYRRKVLFPQEILSSLSPARIVRAVQDFLYDHWPDCVCLNGYSSPLALGALAWCRRWGVPTVLMSESTPWDHPRWPLQEWLKSRVVRQCSAALVGGPSHSSYLQDLGLPEAVIFSGYDVVDNAHFEVPGALPSGLPEDFFLACSRFTPKKNLRFLITAYAHYRHACTMAKLSPWSLVLVGDGPDRVELVALVFSLHLEASVIFAGAQGYAQLPGYYAQARVFVHASTSEQWGLVVNEAAAAGLPLLVSDRCGCQASLVLEGVNGFSFSPSSPQDLVNRMITFTSVSQVILRQFGDSSRSIISLWSPARFASGLRYAIAEAQVSSSLRPRRRGLLDRFLLRFLALR